MITLIGITIFLLAEIIFDFKAVGGSTNWSIFYFTSTYLAFTLVAMDQLFKETSKTIRYTSTSFALFFVILLVMELSFINVPFDEYISGVNENKLRIITIGLLAVATIFITTMAWGKRRSKR